MSADLIESLPEELENISRTAKDGQVITASEAIKRLAIRLDKQGLAKPLKELQED
jgi:hypothetical protein